MNHLEKSDFSLKEQMYQVLLEEMSAYDYLNETLREKQEAIVKNEIKNVERLTGVEQVVASRANRLTQTRYELMQQYFMEKNITADAHSLGNVIGSIEEDNRKRWERVGHRIHSTALEIKRLNAENMRLIEHSLGYVRGMINLFLPRDEFGGNIYTESGNENINVSAKNMLDCNA